jgi:ABC-type sulfate transport system permease component
LHVLSKSVAFKQYYSLYSFIPIILAFGAVTKEQSKTTQVVFNHRVLSAYEESYARSSKEIINAGGGSQ